MNLKRLLTVGGSLEERKRPSARYRMAPEGVLPKFELRGDTITAVPMEGVVPSKKSPVKNSPGPLFDALADQPAPAPVASREPVAPLATASSPVLPAPNPFAATVPQRPVKVGLWRVMFGAIGSALSDAFSGRKNRLRKRSLDAAVQGELGLDAVKPLRNDLSNSDYEVVAAPVVSRPKFVVHRPAADPPQASGTEASPVRSNDAELLGAKD